MLHVFNFKNMIRFYEYNMVLGGFDFFVVKIILFLISWFGYFKKVCIAC